MLPGGGIDPAAKNNIAALSLHPHSPDHRCAIAAGGRSQADQNILSDSITFSSQLEDQDR